MTGSRQVIFILIALCWLVSADENSLSRSDADMWFLQAKFNYYERYDFEKAYECLQKALTLDPEHSGALELQSEMAEIAEFLEQAAESHSGMPDSPAVLPEDEIIAEVEAVPVPEEDDSEPETDTGSEQDFYYRLALRQIEEFKFKQARENLWNHIKYNPESIKAYTYLFLIGVRENDEILIDKVFKGSVGFVSSFSGSPDFEKFIQAVECYKKRLLIGRAVMQFNRDARMKNEVVAHLRPEFLDADRNRPSYPLMKELKTDQLIKEGYLQQDSGCPLGGVFELETGRIICTYHDSLLKMPFREELVAELPVKKPVTLTDKHHSYMHIDNARKYLREKRYYRAIAEAEEAVGYDADDFRGYDVLAQAHYFLKQYDKALENAEKAREIGIDQPSVYNNLGLILVELGRTKQAIRIFKIGLLLQNSDFDLLYNLAVSCLKEDDIEQAVRNFEIAAIVRPDHPGVYFNLGKIAQLRSDKEMARKHYQKLLNLVPQEGKVYNMVVNILENL